MPIAKDVVSGKELHARMLKGVNTLSDAVCCTLGPGGQFVAIETPSGVPHVTKDGYTVAKSIILEDPIENMGAELVKQAAVKQNELSGDGTTTTTCLAQAFYQDAVGSIDTGAHPVDIKKDLEQLSELACSKLLEMSTPVDEEDYFDIAMVSSNGDEELSLMVAEAWETTGKSGFVLAVASKNQATTLNVSDGYLAEGYVPNPMFLTSRDKGMAEYEDGLIVLLTGSKELTLGQLNPMFEMWAKYGAEKPLVILARGMKENLMGMLHRNRVEKGLPILPILTDLMDHEEFEDLGLFLNCEVFTDVNLDFQRAGQLGTLFGSFQKIAYKGRRLVITPKDDHVFSNHYHDRVNLLKNTPTSANEEERNYINKRLGRMTGGVGIITVGGQTESEAKERKDRFDDAIHAVKASFSEGVLPGAGVALSKISDDLKGFSAFAPCFRAPIERLYQNVGQSAPDPEDANVPVNLRTGWHDSGILDPTKVVVDAVRDAVSVAVLLTMTNHAVAFNNEALDSFKQKVVDNTR